MAVNGQNPAIQVINASGPIVGAKLYVYDAGTTNLKSIYSDDGLATPLTNPLSGDDASNALGFFPVFYMALGTYKLRAETSADVPIWEYDDLDTGLSAGAGALPIASGGTGATTAAAARAALDVPSNSELAALSAEISDFTDSLVNTIGFPQVRLSLTSGTPYISSGVTAGTSVYCIPTGGNICPIYDGVQFNPKTFAELTCTLASQHSASAIFDFFMIDDSDTRRIVTGPAWASATAGSCSRGTGAGTTELTRVNGLLVNAYALATARNGASTYAVAANQGTYLGSLFVDGSNGQATCHTAAGQSRKWAIWNYYNRAPISLVVFDSTATWDYSTNTVRQSRATAGNKATVFCGMAEEEYRVSIKQVIGLLNASSGASLGVGWNSTTAYSGMRGSYTVSGSSTSQFYPMLTAEHVNGPSLGINEVNFLESGNGTATASFLGGQEDMQMIVNWRG